MVRCCICNENSHVDCIGFTVAEAEGIWNCIHCTGVTNQCDAHISETIQ